MAIRASQRRTPVDSTLQAATACDAPEAAPSPDTTWLTSLSGGNRSGTPPIMSLQDSYHCFFKRGISSLVRGSLHFTLSAKCLAVSRSVTNISSPSSLAVFGCKSSSSATSSTVTVPLRVNVGGFPFVDRDCCASERSHSFFL